MVQCSASILADSFIDTLLEDFKYTERDEGIGDERFDRELSQEALEKIVGMCRQFFIDNEEDILSDEIECDYRYWGNNKAARTGHEFYMQVVGHGGGFWDGRYPQQIGNRLSDACGPYAYSIEPYVGDDGLVYV